MGGQSESGLAAAEDGSGAVWRGAPPVQGRGEGCLPVQACIRSCPACAPPSKLGFPRSSPSAHAVHPLPTFAHGPVATLQPCLQASNHRGRRVLWRAHLPRRPRPLCLRRHLPARQRRRPDLQGPLRVPVQLTDSFTEFRVARGAACRERHLLLPGVGRAPLTAFSQCTLHPLPAEQSCLVCSSASSPHLPPRLHVCSCCS